MRCALHDVGFRTVGSAASHGSGSDWGPITISGTTIVGGNPTNRGGLFAIDVLNGAVAGLSLATGKEVWRGPDPAFDKASGGTVWELPGKYSVSSPSTAVAGNVLYFQGSPDIKRAVEARGALHALDLDTRAILWSFSRPTAERNWPFGHVTPINGTLWVDSYQALVKLQ